MIFDIHIFLIGLETASRSTTNYYTHPRLHPEEIELKRLFLAGLFTGLLPGWALEHSKLVIPILRWHYKSEPAITR